MPDRRSHHISSAVIIVLPGRADDVVAAITSMKTAEIRARDGGRIVVVMEGATSGELGSRLAEIASLSGVISANMVFECIEELEETAP
jgi:nitrate reductase NapD